MRNIVQHALHSGRDTRETVDLLNRQMVKVVVVFVVGVRLGEIAGGCDEILRLHRARVLQRLTQAGNRDRAGLRRACQHGCEKARALANRSGWR
jgi:hypothetical protein